MPTKVVLAKWLLRILIVALTILLINALLSKAEQTTFSPELWQKTPQRARFIYLEDLTQNKLHAGMTDAEVISLLGVPDYRANDGSYITYIVGGAQGVFSFSALTILDIRFKDGRIEKVLTRED